MSRTDDLNRIRHRLETAAGAPRPFVPGQVQFTVKVGRGDPLTEADLAVDRALRRSLVRDGEGWLGEESADDDSRLHRRDGVWRPGDGCHLQRRAGPRPRPPRVDGAVVRASRSETRRGEWDRFADAASSIVIHSRFMERQV